MLTTNWRKWFYNEAAEDWPNSIGYYVGFKICESYYQNAKDKKQAIKDIVEVTDCEEFFKKIKYDMKFQ